MKKQIDPRKMFESYKQGKAMTDALTQEVEEALGLLDAESADAIIDTSTPDYETLIRGAKAVLTLQWMLMKQHGVRESPASLKGQAQAMTMVLTMVHYAYALGIQWGRDGEA